MISIRVQANAIIINKSISCLLCEAVRATPCSCSELDLLLFVFHAKENGLHLTLDRPKFLSILKRSKGETIFVRRTQLTMYRHR